MTPEGRVKNMVKKALTKLGDDCWRFMPVQSGYGSVALDFLIAYRGRFIAIETKAPGKTLTPLQESTKAAIEAAGGLVFVVWDDTSLDLAMKIILAVEFSKGGQTEIRSCLDASFTDEQRRGLLAVTAGPKGERAYREHVRAVQQDQAPDPSAGGDHGASRTTPRRRAKPAARGDD